jgi:hypothetical protein
MILAGSRVFTFPQTITRAESKHGEAVDKANQEQIGVLEETYTVGSVLNEFKTDFLKVVSECSSENWDGYSARPVSRDTIITAWRFGHVIPLGLFKPSVGAEPDGHVTFDWRAGPRRVLSVSVDGCGNLHYAALLGPDRHFGTESFVGVVPNRILELMYAIIA